MKDLSVKYLGLKLKNPIIVGSCGLTNSVAKIRELAENNAGAVVLKSLFEEQIQAELASTTTFMEAILSDIMRLQVMGAEQTTQEIPALLDKIRAEIGELEATEKEIAALA